MIHTAPAIEIIDYPSYSVGDKIVASKHKNSYTGTISEVVNTPQGCFFRVDNYQVLYAASELKLASPYDAPIYYQKATTRKPEMIAGIRI